MMVKFRKIISSEYHLCYAHTIHLAVCNVLYKKRVHVEESTVQIENISYEEEGDDRNIGDEELIEYLDEELDLEFDAVIAVYAMFHTAHSMTNITETIKNIRGIMKFIQEITTSQELYFTKLC
ncbi:hypothetical protein AVEN_123264-1 [Araneus ventricosus]|uniref:Uncharacterized protein n=1 Tax=Araneus ventricosus TaxID=182803 RepID=A0A4Y2P555_ARAVE|nr:hypothetical protein AVEN_97704-1 [Araneus ventricosus]GBN47048.1 hypothetical protein AVEN_123264-1 [Araneus ventricosus]